MTLRVLAPRFRAKGHTYAQRISRLRTITPAAQSITLTVSRDVTGRVDAQSVASQLRAGRTAYLQTQAAGGAWRTVASRRMTTSRVLQFADVMTAAQASGLRMRAYLLPFHGAAGDRLPDRTCRRGSR